MTSGERPTKVPTTPRATSSLSRLRTCLVTTAAQPKGRWFITRWQQPVMISSGGILDLPWVTRLRAVEA